ncbi:ATP-dependent zinc protease family protein [Pseudomonas kribbensis]|uniref:retropepsin-like aspartic peptidase RloA3 n=1 Tax=Pseudomonas kribbensis TaxID=1628086 RepID=UPI003D77E746
MFAQPAYSASHAKAPDKVFGWVEEGVLVPENISVKIKLDTGALTSSLDAKDLESFEKDGEKWVRFKVEVKDTETGKQVSTPFERKVERRIKVRGAGGAEHRPVVLMSLCIGDHVYTEQFSLKNRGKMNYPVLIGRRTLQSLGAVDASRTFTVEPKCESKAASN